MLLFTTLCIEESFFPHVDHVQINTTLQIVCDHVSFFLTVCDYFFHSRAALKHHLNWSQPHPKRTGSLRLPKRF